MISNKSNVENYAFRVGFALLKVKLIEKFELKKKLLRQKFNNQFYTRSAKSFQASTSRLNLKTYPLALEKYDVADETFFNFAFKEKHKKRGKYCLIMIDN